LRQAVSEVSSSIEFFPSQSKGTWVPFVILDGVMAKKSAAMPDVERRQAVALRSSLDADLLGAIRTRSIGTSSIKKRLAMCSIHTR